jgi:hypothetical protein
VGLFDGYWLGWFSFNLNTQATLGSCSWSILHSPFSMKHHFLATALGLISLLASCKNKEPAPVPPQLYGSTWSLTTRTVVAMPASGTPTTTTSSVVSGAFSIVYPGDGTYHLMTGGATATGKCDYDGKTITLYNIVGATHTRVMTITSLTATELVTVEQGQDATTSYSTTDTYTRL